MIGEVYFLTIEEVIAIHADQIDRSAVMVVCVTGGLLDSAVHAAQNVAAYVEDWDLCDLAVAYIFHIAENQPFVDGNKRVALASALVFLHQNGVEIDDPGEQLYDVMIGAATKAMGKPQVASVLRRSSCHPAACSLARPSLCEMRRLR